MSPAGQPSCPELAAAKLAAQPVSVSPSKDISHIPRNMARTVSAPHAPGQQGHVGVPPNARTDVPAPVLVAQDSNERSELRRKALCDRRRHGFGGRIDVVARASAFRISKPAVDEQPSWLTAICATDARAFAAAAASL